MMTLYKDGTSRRIVIYDEKTQLSVQQDGLFRSAKDYLMHEFQPNKDTHEIKTGMERLVDIIAKKEDERC